MTEEAEPEFAELKSSGTPTAVKVSLALCAVSFAMVAVLGIQLQRRNGEIDKLEISVDQVQVAVDEVKVETTRIGDIADRYASGNDGQVAAFQRMLCQIGAIYVAVTDPGATPAACT